MLVVMELIINRSALKRPEIISEDDVIAVVLTGAVLGYSVDGLLWFLGATLTGLDIEVACVVIPGGDLVAIHSFPMKWK